ncbi:hypothetical protein JCM10450v2_006322 [Rhodotorula kratochvilovae]
MARTLPHELVLLILDRLKLLLTEEEDRRDECKRLALVCRSWTEAAQALGWSFISLTKGTNDPLLAHLLAHPRLLPHVDSLQVSASGPASAELYNSFGEVSDPLLQCLRGCTRLRRLSLPPCMSDSPYFDALGDLPSAASIQSLHLTLIANGVLEVGQLVRCVGRLPALRILGLRIAISDAEVTFAKEERPPPLNIEELKVSFMALPGSDELQTLANGLLSAINRDTLKVLHIDSYMADQTFYRGIDTFHNLDRIIVQATSHEQVRDGPGDFAAVLPGLQKLSELAIMVGKPSPLERLQGTAGGQPVFAPIPLGEFAAVLPPSIKEAHIQGVYFDEGDLEELPVALHAAAREPGLPEVSVLVHDSQASDDGEGDPPVTFNAKLCRVEPEEGGKPRWHRRENDEFSEAEWRALLGDELLDLVQASAEREAMELEEAGE